MMLTLKESLVHCQTWPDDMRAELIRNWENTNVGSRLVSETEAVKVWHIELPPGGRMPLHRHCRSYFWTALSHGVSQSHSHDGRVSQTSYRPGDTKHYTLTDGDFFIHDLENIGETALSYVTVEFLTR